MFKPCGALLTDFYKQCHAEQYDPSITKVVSYYVPRKTSIPEFDKVVVFGIQAFIEEYLIEYMNENFFNRPLEEVIAEYEFVISSTMGVGDHECDYCPCQVGQFESSTVAINQCLSKIYLEGRGGGNSGESYLLPWIIAGNHTSIDSWEKRKQKGFLFTVGDEPTLTRISRGTLASLTGMEYERDYTWQEAYELACEKYHVFHIHVRHGSEHYDEVVAKQMKEILRENFIVCKPDEVVEAICEAMGKTLKGSSSVIEEVSAEKTVENTKSKPNIFDIHRR